MRGSQNQQKPPRRKACPNGCDRGYIIEYITTTSYDLNGHKTEHEHPVQRICPRCGGSGEVYE